MVFLKKLSIYKFSCCQEFYERRSCRVISIIAPHPLFVPFFSSINAEGYRGKKLYTARKLVEVESSGVRSEVRLGHSATCAPIRRVNLPTCFASRRIVSRARDIDSSQLPLITDSSVFHTRLVFQPWPVIYFALHVPEIGNILFQEKTKTIFTYIMIDRNF